ncbi:hypothetical protein [Blastopirellula marina]|uniref:Uncharacterized protein n=1 Tax=Blastopirellula marina TaxID=124 RepID=A0A2S8FTG0_9BACT|nr:hypothetical protein [Blastopirellula marina]PQO35472.1 hypothetical protein C5Y98_14015 [Blastopirellula marina]PTL44112.1 hypothetical protein C5Y97_14025 [Blastopirellula marina]
MADVNNFPQLMEIAQRLPEYPWEAELNAKLQSGGNGPWPTDDELEAAEREQSPQYLAEHRQLLTAARSLLRQPCENWAAESAEAWREGSSVRLQKARHLGRVFALSSIASQRGGDQTLAIEDAKNCLRLAIASRKGGLVVDYLVSAGIEGFGIDRIRVLRRDLSPESRQSLIHFLEQHEAAREPYDLIADRDADWEAKFGSEAEEDDSWIDDEEFADLSPEERQKINAMIEENRQRLAEMSPEEIALNRRNGFAMPDRHSLSLQRLLRIELAILSYQAEKGSQPERLDQLAPHYLTTVPLDPRGGEQYRYRHDGLGYVLYGLNEHLIDCGGRQRGVCSIHDGTADLFLDYFDFPDDLASDEGIGFGCRILQAIRSTWRSIVRA